MTRLNAPKPNTYAQREEAEENAVQAIAAADYTENMFKDGSNVLSKRTAQGYDEAANREDLESPTLYANTDNVETLLDAPADTTHSRDGTDAAGRDDEFGGSLGGTEEELDALEASSVPVDKNKNMKD